LVALVCSLLSLDTAARFFSERMGIDGLPIRGVSVELVAVCGVGELTLIACGYAMSHSVRRHGKPGAAQLVALTLCGAATFMAVALDGPVAGALRAFFGPILALITLHLALGIEVKVRRSAGTGAWVRIVSELRERFLSRLGLGDDGRLAAERSRDRARDKAARLATATGWVPWRDERLQRALRTSHADRDPAQRALLLEQIATLRGAAHLATVEIESPWSAAVPAHVQRVADAAQRSIDARRAAADREAAETLAAAEAAAAALRAAAQQQAEAQHRSAAQQRSAAAAEAAAIKADAERAAAGTRKLADDYWRDRETSAQRQIEQVIAAARAEAAEIRSVARADAQVLRSVVNRSTEAPPKGDAPPRSNGRSAASIEDLVNALAEQWPNGNPSDRAAIKYLRQRFNGCGDQRARDAAAALRARRGAAPDAADAERLQVSTTKINGFNHDLTSLTA
jgi:hypothetical protein